MRSLVVLPNWVGDTVMALPVLESLAATDRRVSVLGRPHLLSLLEGQSSIDEFIGRDPSTTAMVRRLENAAFNEAVVLPNSFRSAWIAYRAGIPQRWGYGGRSPERLLRSAILSPAVSDHRQRHRPQIEDYVELVAAMGIEAPVDWTPRLEISSQERGAGQDLLARSRLDPNRSPLIGLFAGAEFGPSKQWPWERFAELSRSLRRHRPESQQLILAGPKETWLAVRIHEESGKIHPVVGPDLDLGQLATVLAQLDLLVTNDSGPMHMAAALGVPCLAIFGPTDPRRTRPAGEIHRVLYTDRWCSPCFRRRCPLVRHRCMRDITVEEVTRTAAEMLERKQ